jgi:hypothetical protein
MTDTYRSVRNKINLPKTYNVSKDTRKLFDNLELFPPLSKENEENLYELS